MATQVPNTNTFSLQDVSNVVGGTSLVQCFANSVDAYFDPAYKGAKDSLSNFRNYSTAQYPSGKWVTAVAIGGQIFRSYDYGTTFTPVDSVRNWYGISIDSSGMYQTAVVNNGYIYTSNNFGVTWTQRGSSQSWGAVSISSDGKYQTAVVRGGYIYVSSDYGFNWTVEGSSLNYWSVDVSPTGKYQIAGVDGGYIWISTDYGINWTQHTGLGIKYSPNVYVNKNGAIYLVTTSSSSGGNIWVTSDGGTTWNLSSTYDQIKHFWGSIDGSNDGLYVVAGSTTGTIWHNTNTSFLGISWGTASEQGDWNVASGYNGSHMYSANMGGFLYTSNNYGVQWGQIYTVALQWSGIATN